MREFLFCTPGWTVWTAAALLLTAATASAAGESILRARPPEPRAILLQAPAFDVAADGQADDTAALQAAVLEADRRRQVLFIPEGTYRLAATVRVPRGVRIFGVGKTRPVLLLASGTPSFGSAEHPTPMLHFVEALKKDGTVVEAKNTTFFSALANVNLRVEAGNPGAVGVRAYWAQHCYVRDVDFHLSDAWAGMHRVGNEIHRCRFSGGRYGIVSEGGTSAGWQFTILDSAFEGQARACIRSTRLGLTVLGTTFTDAPVGITVPPDADEGEKLYVEASHFARIAGPVVRTGEHDDPANWVHLEGVGVADVGALLEFRDGHPGIAAPEGAAKVDLMHGLVVDEEAGAFRTICKPNPAPPTWNATRPLPPVKTWKNVRDFGAVGDGEADDTAALRRAVAEAKVVYLPAGTYRLTDTLALGAETVLVGLHPRETRLRVAAETSAFDDAADPKPMLLAPKGGRCVVTGIGFRTRAPGATTVRWEAGPQSLLDDVWMDWSKRQDHPGAPSIEVTGGGTFTNLWSADPHAASGLWVHDTDVPGRVFQISVEHHREVEVRVERVRGWRFYALQTEENMNSPKALALDVRDSADLVFANYFAYRVMAMKEPAPYAARIEGSRGVSFRGIHNFSWGPQPFAASVHDATRGRTIKPREIGLLKIP